MVRLDKTKRAAATYIAFAATQRFISLLILPLVTHAMPPNEYGAASLISSTSVFVTAIVAAPLIQLIVRVESRKEEAGPAIVRVSGLYCYLVLPAFAVIAAAFVAFSVKEVLGISGLLWAIEIVAIGLQPAASTFALSVAQANDDMRRFLWLSATSVLVNVISKLLLVVVFSLGVFGWVVSDLLSAAASAVVAAFLVRLPEARVGLQHARYAISFSLPLIPHNVSLVAIGFLSRPALALVSTLGQVGLLSFALNISQFATVVILEVNRALLNRYARESFRAPSAETLKPVGWQLVIAFLVPAAIGIGLALFGPLLFAKAYWPSFFLTGVLLLGQAAYGLYLIPMNYLTQTGGVTRYSAVISGAGAALILASIFWLGGRFGAMGLACATAVGYMVMALAAMLVLIAHRFEIAWNSWITNWPEIFLAMISLMCAVGALASEIGGVTSRVLATVSFVCAVVSVVFLT